MSNKNFFGKRALRPEEMPFICAGDVETAGLGGELLSIQWGTSADDIKVDTSADMVANFFNDLLDNPKPCIWFFHFGQYDWRYFLDYITENNLLVDVGMRTENDIYEIRVRRNSKDDWSIMRDSFALWSHPLADLADRFCPEIPKQEIDIENFNPLDPVHIEYAKRDVEILLRGLPRLYDMVHDHFNVYPSATAAGTAMKAWQESLDSEVMYDAQKYDEVELFIREGYYGGLVFLTTNRVLSDVETYDVNSSYPYQMETHGVPYGRAIYTTEFEPHYAGFYRVSVKAPDDLVVPILPARNERGFMRWYRGVFDTVVTVQELQFATQHGYEVLKVHEGFIFEDIVFPFSNVVSKCRELRFNNPKSAVDQLAKLVQNSLYGRYASRRERTRLLLASGLDLDNDFDGVIPFDDEGQWVIKKELDETMKCLPQWAAYITANARLHLLKAVYSVGVENVYYGDTDSITIRKGLGHLLSTGKEYGQWKLDKEWSTFRAIAPKVYSGILTDGTFTGAAKGLPKRGVSDNTWRDLLESGTSSADALSLDSLKTAIKNGVKPARVLTRRSSSLDNSINYEINGRGDVRVKYATG